MTGPVSPAISHSYENRRLKMIAARAVGDVLDVGHAQLPNPHLDPARTVGIDLAAPDRPSGYRRDVVGSAADLGTALEGERFDTLVAAEFIEHLESPYDFLRSCHEALRPDGRLVLSTPNPLGFPVLFFELTRNRRRFYTADHTYYFLPRWVERMLDHTGFDLVETAAVGIWLPRGYLPWSPVWLSYQVIYVGRPRHDR